MSEKTATIDGTPALDVRALCKSFAGLRAVDDVSLELRYGTVLGIIGPNGAGKSTFVNLASGLIRPDSGTVLLDGEDLGRDGLAKRARRGLLRTFQHTRTFTTMTVREAVRLSVEAPRARKGDGPSGDIDDTLASFGLDGYADSVAADLPYGVQKVLNLALIAQCHPKVLLLDEPFAGVSEVDIERLSGVVRRFRDEGVAIGVIEHNMEALLPLVDAVVVLDTGRVLFRGSSHEMLASAEVRAAYLGGTEAVAA